MPTLQHHDWRNTAVEWSSKEPLLSSHRCTVQSFYFVGTKFLWNFNKLCSYWITCFIHVLCFSDKFIGEEDDLQKLSHLKLLLLLQIIITIKYNSKYMCLKMIKVQIPVNIEVHVHACCIWIQTHLMGVMNLLLSSQMIMAFLAYMYMCVIFLFPGGVSLLRQWMDRAIVPRSTLYMNLCKYMY